jgi:signal transduction histidine kinase
VIHVDGVNDAVRFRVLDTGPGMPPERVEKLFDWQGRGSSGRPSDRVTALSLRLCRELVLLQGGRMWVDSEPGRGTTFAFTVPAAILRDEVTHHGRTAAASLTRVWRQQP